MVLSGERDRVRDFILLEERLEVGEHGDDSSPRNSTFLKVRLPHLLPCPYDFIVSHHLRHCTLLGGVFERVHAVCRIGICHGYY